MTSKPLTAAFGPVPTRPLPRYVRDLLTAIVATGRVPEGLRVRAQAVLDATTKGPRP
jgi:hypothetical protein